jgi:hypothetical protein
LIVTPIGSAIFKVTSPWFSQVIPPDQEVRPTGGFKSGSGQKKVTGTKCDETGDLG